MAESTATYSLKYPARALCPVLADKKTSQWLVGTNSLREENEVRVETKRTAPPRVITEAACPRLNYVTKGFPNQSSVANFLPFVTAIFSSLIVHLLSSARPLLDGARARAGPLHYI